MHGIRMHLNRKCVVHSHWNTMRIGQESNGYEANGYSHVAACRCVGSLQLGAPESNTDTIYEIEFVVSWEDRGINGLVATRLASAGADCVDRLVSAEAKESMRVLKKGLEEAMWASGIKANESIRALAIDTKRSMWALAIKAEMPMRALAIKL